MAPKKGMYEEPSVMGEWLRNYLKIGSGDNPIPPPPRPLVIPIGQLAKRDREVRELEKAREELQIRINVETEALAEKLAKMGRLSQEIEDNKKKITLNPDKLHRRLEID